MTLILENPLKDDPRDRPKGVDRYGSHYWCIKSTLAQDGEIFLNADRIEVSPFGALLCYGAFSSTWERTDVDDARRIPLVAFAPGQWLAFFAASCMDGHAIAVAHWKVPPEPKTKIGR